MILAGVLLTLGGYGILRVSEHARNINTRILAIVGGVGI